MRVTLWLFVVALSVWGTAVAAGDGEPERALVRVDASRALRIADRRRLLGTNVALWNAAANFASPMLRRWIAELGPGLVRMPGGSWSDITYWNGHGVRDVTGKVDHSRMRDGYPAIDYSDYARAILVLPDRSIRPGQWHGNVDVKTLHEFIRSVPGAETLVTVNAGTGRPLDAAEWVRWANLKMGYGVRYWEVGNELEGHWEAGHFLPDGTELTGEMYARRFAEFARAMKAVDPSIRIGGAAGGSSEGGFAEAMLRAAGRHVDFVSWHTYPLRSTMSHDEMLSLAASDVADAVRRVRALIRKYQPDREDQIELGITEWNMGLEGTLSRDMFGALWTATFIGEMFRNGVDFANQWDAFTGGGSLVHADEPFARKAQYWAMYMWRHYMADTLLDCEVEGPPFVRAFATRSPKAVCLMAINTSPESEVALGVEVSGFQPSSEGSRAVLCRRQYFWNPIEGRPEWSSPPEVTSVVVGVRFQLRIPPFAIVCVRVPASGEETGEAGAPPAPSKPEGPPPEPTLRLLLPDSGYDDTELRGWALACCGGGEKPYPLALPNARIEVDGPAEADRASVRLAEAVGEFILRPSGPGKVTVTVRLGERAASAEVLVKRSEPKPRVLWEFESKSLPGGYRSDWKLSTDANVKPNQRVARIDLLGVVPDRNHQALLVISAFPPPAKLNRANIRGVFFDLLVSRDFHCEDPDARLEVVMQSPADYWMSLGSASLASARGKWVHHEVGVTQPRHIKAMPSAHNVWFVLRSREPVTGSIFLDRVGLLVR